MRFLSYVPIDYIYVITAYQDEVVPNILLCIKKALPALYEELLATYPKYDIVSNHVGKSAFVSTMVDGSILVDSRGNKGVLKGGKIYFESYQSAFLPFDSKNATLVVEVNDKMIYKIDSNEQCDEHTVFV